MRRLMPHNRIASTLMEYAILLGVVAMALVGMNTYIKRGVQGKIADMTDYFIGKEQAVDSNPTAKVVSNSRSNYESDADTYMLKSGVMHLVSLDSAHTVARSRVEDEPKDPIVNGPFTPAEKGKVYLPAFPTDEDIAALYDRKHEEKKYRKELLEKKIDRLIAEAKSLEDAADQMEALGWDTWDKIKTVIDRSEYAKIYLVGILNHWSSLRITAAIYAVVWGYRVGAEWMVGDVAAIWKYAGTGCNRKQCAEGAIEVYNKGKELFAKAAETRAKAALKRGESKDVQDKVDVLAGEIQKKESQP